MIHNQSNLMGQTLSPKSGQLIEPLTKREVEILSLLAVNHTNDEIAASLSLSLNSVKWYASQIYSKLGVNNRRSAVAKASALELLVTSKPSSHEDQSQSLPSGTVTFLFTDIEGSTPLWEKIPEEMAVAVEQHHVILRRAIEENHGHVTQIIGDSFQAAFRLTTDALNAAVTAQHTLQTAQWGAIGQIKVRMGIHTGHAELDKSGNAPYQVSHTLNRTARIMSAGNGGQILLSQESADLIERELPEGISLKDLGEHHLKGMERSEHLYQVFVPGLVQDFPSLATAIQSPHNLPVQLTSFIGREKEIEAVCDLLRNHRLVTLHGSGGVGKTRLSQKVAEAVIDDYPDGVWLVELAPVTDPLLVAQTAATVLGLKPNGSQPIENFLIEYLKRKQALLLLDNCEHLIEACALLVDDLLHACPKLKVLATSREALEVAGEMPYRVPSLSLPKSGPQLNLSEIEQTEAVCLFIERVASSQASFHLTDRNARSVAQVCQRLDGIPLAIELAVARLNVLSIEQLATQLDNAFRLLTGGARTALPRQQTLRATIDWSYKLLSEDEKRLLRRLSVFTGSFDLAGVERVCCLEDRENIEALDWLASLVKKSILVVNTFAKIG